MKYLLTLILSITLFASCEGPEGPAGRPGINILGQVFEVNINLNTANNFEQVVTIPSDIEVYESDALIVYRYEGSFNGADIWTPLPATYFDSFGGTFLYTFNHTYYDLKFFLDGNFNLSVLTPNWTQNQVFRVVLVPAEFANADLSFEELQNVLELEFTGR
ncbi:MAG: hypothetical protein P8O93_05640 [Flavobacteriaceae bacterium]|jgi:hypothetical protein|nr:hypothetical protein [Flavobacteriaceae bacterium]MDG1961992.1 hypothetical protein [Flavobacteriaceae bacterium]